MPTSNILSRLRRALLIKVISRQAPSRADVTSVIELTASKLVEALQAQSITFYLLDGNQISVRQVYFSPTLWADDPSKEQRFIESAAELMTQKIPRGRGIVGRVIDSGEPVFYRNTENKAPFMSSIDRDGWIRSLLDADRAAEDDDHAGCDPGAQQGDVGGHRRRIHRSRPDSCCRKSPNIRRRSSIGWLDPRFHPSAEDAARFISRLTELPLITEAGRDRDRCETPGVDRAMKSSAAKACFRSSGSGRNRSRS